MLRNFVKGLFGAYAFFYLFVAAVFSGSMYRGEMSPWAWVEFPIHAKRHGVGDAIGWLSLYLYFYSGAFVFSFKLAMLKCEQWMERACVGKRHPDRAQALGGCFFLSLFSGLTFIVLLPAIVTALRADWLFWTWLVVGAILLGLTAVAFRKLRARTRIVVPHASNVHCACPTCGKSHDFPAEELRKSNVVRAWEPNEIWERTHVETVEPFVTAR